MDGKIIQEVEGIVSKSGFVRMSEAQTFSASSSGTIQTDFIPKVLLIALDGPPSTLCVKPNDYAVNNLNKSALDNIVWGENYVSFKTRDWGATIIVLG